MVLPAAPRVIRGRDSLLPYRPDPELFYLTGLADPDAVVVLRGFPPEDRFVVFAAERDAEAERWDGARASPEEAGEALEADAAHPLSELEERLPGLLEGADVVHFRVQTQPTGVARRCQTLVERALERARSRGARRGRGPKGVVDPGDVLDELRLVKEPGEVERLRRAAAVTVEGFRDGLGVVRPGRAEREVQAVMEAGFLRRGAQFPAFPTIVGAGANACVLHYVENAGAIAQGDLVLVDAGAEVDLYAADATRTVPASGVFSRGQRDLYDIVESARLRAVERVAPGVRIDSVHHAALRELVTGLREMGVLDGSEDEVIEEREYRRYFPHNTSHWIGMDVHDPGDYVRKGRGRRLRPGMALTVEPGLYIPAGGGPGEEAASPAEALRGTGIRIEDTVLVTDDGHDVLTRDLPAAADRVASLVEGGRDGD